jgi:hypothetical protein
MHAQRLRTSAVRLSGWLLDREPAREVAVSRMVPRVLETIRARGRNARPGRVPLGTAGLLLDVSEHRWTGVNCNQNCNQQVRHSVHRNSRSARPNLAPPSSLPDESSPVSGAVE